MCSEQSEQSGRLTDPPPESFLIPQQLAVPPVPQLDDVPCPKTLGEPGTPKFPVSQVIGKNAHRSIQPPSAFCSTSPFQGCHVHSSASKTVTQHTNKSIPFYFHYIPLCSQHQLFKTIRPSSCAAAFSTTCALVPPTPKELTLAKEPQH